MNTFPTYGDWAFFIAVSIWTFLLSVAYGYYRESKIVAIAERKAECYLHLKKRMIEKLDRLNAQGLIIAALPESTARMIGIGLGMPIPFIHEEPMFAFGIRRTVHVTPIGEHLYPKLKLMQQRYKHYDKLYYENYSRSTGSTWLS